MNCDVLRVPGNSNTAVLRGVCFGELADVRVRTRRWTLILWQERTSIDGHVDHPLMEDNRGQIYPT